MLEIILPIRVTAKDYGFNAVYAGKHWAKRNADAARIHEKVWAEPVSYTHLDVYKRQLVYKAFAEILGLSESSVSERLKNNSQFTQEEMEKTMLFLEIPLEEVERYFFTHIV